jgi:hypothetical protein
MIQEAVLREKLKTLFFDENNHFLQKFAVYKVVCHASSMTISGNGYEDENKKTVPFCHASIEVFGKINVDIFPIDVNLSFQYAGACEDVFKESASEWPLAGIGSFELFDKRIVLNLTVLFDTARMAYINNIIPVLAFNSKDKYFSIEVKGRLWNDSPIDFSGSKLPFFENRKTLTSIVVDSFKLNLSTDLSNRSS